MTGGDFGGERRPAIEGYVGFEVRPDGDGGYIATGGEPDFDEQGEGPTAALAIADYCQKYDDAQRD